MCSRALSIYDNEFGVMEVVDARGHATSLVRLALLLEEQVKRLEIVCTRMKAVHIQVLLR